jgi:hypothetical protein
MVLTRTIHEFATTSADSTESSGSSPSGLFDIVHDYDFIALQSEDPESPALSTLSLRELMNSPG